MCGTRSLGLWLDPEEMVRRGRAQPLGTWVLETPKSANSQSSRLADSVMFQHEINGTLEFGAFEENFFTRVLFTNLQYRQTTR